MECAQRPFPWFPHAGVLRGQVPWPVSHNKVTIFGMFLVTKPQTLFHFHRVLHQHPFSGSRIQSRTPYRIQWFFVTALSFFAKTSVVSISFETVQSYLMKAN